MGNAFANNWNCWMIRMAFGYGILIASSHSVWSPPKKKNHEHRAKENHKLNMTNMHRFVSYVCIYIYALLPLIDWIHVKKKKSSPAGWIHSYLRNYNIDERYRDFRRIPINNQNLLNKLGNFSVSLCVFGAFWTFGVYWVCCYFFFFAFVVNPASSLYIPTN